MLKGGGDRRTGGGRVKADVIPENDNFIHQRIDRAYKHMLAAKTPEWSHRWGDLFVVLVRARNSMRTPAEVRQLESERGLR
jgi:hypothetical protein